MLFETEVEAVEFAPAATLSRARSKAGLSDTELRGLPSRGKPYKVADGQGLYVMVLPSGTKVFRYDYRLEVDGMSKRETLSIGRYEPGTLSRTGDELASLEYGAVVSLKDARVLTPTEN